MGTFLIHFFGIICEFYLFCLCMTHVFIDKPNKVLLFELKTMKSSYLFALLGIGMWSALEKVKIPDKWFYPVYIGCFLSVAIISFVILATNLPHLNVK
jgi:hypothetical protein